MQLIYKRLRSQGTDQHLFSRGRPDGTCIKKCYDQVPPRQILVGSTPSNPSCSVQSVVLSFRGIIYLNWWIRLCVRITGKAHGIHQLSTSKCGCRVTLTTVTFRSIVDLTRLNRLCDRTSGKANGTIHFSASLYGLFSLMTLM